MAKVYLITQIEMKILEDKMALIKATQIESLDVHDPIRHKLNDLYSRIHYDVFSWVSDVTR